MKPLAIAPRRESLKRPAPQTGPSATADTHSPQMPSKPPRRENYSAGTKQLSSTGLSGRPSRIL